MEDVPEIATQGDVLVSDQERKPTPCKLTISGLKNCARFAVDDSVQQHLGRFFDEASEMSAVGLAAVCAGTSYTMNNIGTAVPVNTSISLPASVQVQENGLEELVSPETVPWGQNFAMYSSEKVSAADAEAMKAKLEGSAATDIQGEINTLVLQHDLDLSNTKVVIGQLERLEVEDGNVVQVGIWSAPNGAMRTKHMPITETTTLGCLHDKTLSLSHKAQAAAAKLAKAVFTKLGVAAQNVTADGTPRALEQTCKLYAVVSRGKTVSLNFGCVNIMPSNYMMHNTGSNQHTGISVISGAATDPVQIYEFGPSQKAPLTRRAHDLEQFHDSMADLAASNNLAASACRHTLRTHAMRKPDYEGITVNSSKGVVSEGYVPVLQLMRPLLQNMTLRKDTDGFVRKVADVNSLSFANKGVSILHPALVIVPNAENPVTTKPPVSVQDMQHLLSTITSKSFFIMDSPETRQLLQDIDSKGLPFTFMHADAAVHNPHDKAELVGWKLDRGYMKKHACETLKPFL